MSNATTYTDKALELLEKGFSSKAAQKNALDYVSRAYDMLYNETHMAWIAHSLEATEATSNNLVANDNYSQMVILHDLPFSLHHLSEKKHNTEANTCGSEWSKFADLKALRDLIKAEEIVKVEPAEKPLADLKARVEKSMVDVFEADKSSYIYGLKLAKIFGDLPVTMNVHYVTNQFGATFPRAFYYMAGKLTKLNIILAVMQATEKK